VEYYKWYAIYQTRSLPMTFIDIQRSFSVLYCVFLKHRS